MNFESDKEDGLSSMTLNMSPVVLVLKSCISACCSVQVTQKVPELANSLLAGIPETVDVKGMELNISLAGDPIVTPEALTIRDWGRFQNPSGQSSGDRITSSSDNHSLQIFPL